MTFTKQLIWLPEMLVHCKIGIEQGRRHTVDVAVAVRVGVPVEVTVRYERVKRISESLRSS